jgi:hypothetical protein
MREILGSARVSRAGFGVPSKQSFLTTKLQTRKGNDANSYRAGFIELVRKAQAIRKG